MRVCLRYIKYNIFINDDYRTSDYAICNAFPDNYLRRALSLKQPGRWKVPSAYIARICAGALAVRVKREEGYRCGIQRGREKRQRESRNREAANRSTKARENYASRKTCAVFVTTWNLNGNDGSVYFIYRKFTLASGNECAKRSAFAKRPREGQRENSWAASYLNCMTQMRLANSTNELKPPWLIVVTK